MKRIFAPGVHAILYSRRLPLLRSFKWRSANEFERNVSHVTPRGIWTPPSRSSSSLIQENACRTFCTSYKEGLDTQEKSSQSSTSVDSHGALSSQTEAHSTQAPVAQTPSVDIAVDSAFKSSSRHDLAMIFTCTICNVRSAKTMSRATYDTGVVIVRCPGCQNLHLIADRYGWFGKAGSVEDFLAEKGIDVRKGSDGTYEFTVEDVAGWTSNPQEISTE